MLAGKLADGKHEKLLVPKLLPLLAGLETRATTLSWSVLPFRFLQYMFLLSYCACPLETS